MASYFYKIPENCYLFGKTSSPEEDVRQWVLFELIATYHVNLNQIKIEYPIKIGTSRHAIDIVVSIENIPYLVIECKANISSEREMKKAYEQTLSYATHHTINAEYFIITDGKLWKNYRRINETWQQIDSLPYKALRYTFDQNSFIALTNNLYDIALLLYWLGKEIPSTDVRNFFDNLQSFFYSGNYYGFNRDLWEATGCLLKMMPSNLMAFTPYTFSKILSVIQYISSYLHDIKGSGVVHCDIILEKNEKSNNLVYTDIRNLVKKTSYYFNTVLRACLATASNNQQSYNIPLFKVLIVLLQYISEQHDTLKTLLKEKEYTLDELADILQEPYWYRPLSIHKSTEMYPFFSIMCTQIFGCSLPPLIDQRWDEFRFSLGEAVCKHDKQENTLSPIIPFEDSIMEQLQKNKKRVQEMQQSKETFFCKLKRWYKNIKGYRLKLINETK